MALWDAADLLARSKRLLNRPTSDQGMTDADWYAFLTEGQAKWFEIIATHAPHVLYGDPEQLTTADGGETYDFASTPFPGGHIEVRQSRSGPVLRIGQDWEASADFTWEGDKLRVPDGQSRTFSDGPFARYVAAPAVIDASTAPTLKPPAARLLIVYDALAHAAVRMGTHDPATFRDLEQRAAWGDPRNPGDVGIIGTLKTQIYPGAGTGRWWLRTSGEGYKTV
jgi:hypothetical protein